MIEASFFYRKEAFLVVEPSSLDSAKVKRG